MGGIIDVEKSPFYKTAVVLHRINASNSYMTDSPKSINFYKTNNWAVSAGWSINSVRLGIASMKVQEFMNTYENFEIADMGDGIRDVEISPDRDFSQFGLNFLVTYLNTTPNYTTWWTNGKVNCIKLVVDCNKVF